MTNQNKLSEEELDALRAAIFEKQEVFQVKMSPLSNESLQEENECIESLYQEMNTVAKEKEEIKLSERT